RIKRSARKSATTAPTAIFRMASRLFGIGTLPFVDDGKLDRILPALLLEREAGNVLPFAQALEEGLHRALVASESAARHLAAFPHLDALGPDLAGIREGGGQALEHLHVARRGIEPRAELA